MSGAETIGADSAKARFDSGADISVAASQITGSLKDEILRLRDDPSEEHLKVTLTDLEKGCNDFFSYALNWAKNEKETKHKSAENHPEAGKLREKAQSSLQALEKTIIDYILSTCKVDYALGYSARELIRCLPPDKRGKIKRQKHEAWTKDSSDLLQRYFAERDVLLDTTRRLYKGFKALETLDPQLAEIEKLTASLAGPKADSLMTTFRSSVRMQNYQRAEKVIRDLTETKKTLGLDLGGKGKQKQILKELAENYIAAMKEVESFLLDSEGKTLLKTAQVGVILNWQVKELEQKTLLIVKYQAPYIEHVMSSFNHLKEKMLVIGSIESLFTLYVRLIRGLSEPLDDLKKVKTYESEVLEKVGFLTGGQYQDLKNINERREEKIVEFKKVIEQFQK